MRSAYQHIQGPCQSHKLATQIYTTTKGSTPQTEQLQLLWPTKCSALVYQFRFSIVIKGHVLAGIIADNWNQQRQRAIWLSVNNDLLESARRDLTDLGLANIPLSRINDYPPAGEITLPRGVIFSSYSALIAAAKTGEKRIDQI